MFARGNERPCAEREFAPLKVLYTRVQVCATGEVADVADFAHRAYLARTKNVRSVVQMEEAEIVRIERALGYSLPGEYRYFLWRHTDEVREIGELLEFRAVLWIDADEIIEGNRELDKQADVMLVGDEPWPDTFFLVGTNGGGDYWFVDRTGARSGVWFWQHEAQKIEEHHDSFEDYMEALRSDARDPKKWQGPFG